MLRLVLDFGRINWVQYRNNGLSLCLGIYVLQWLVAISNYERVPSHYKMVPWSPGYLLVSFVGVATFCILYEIFILAVTAVARGFRLSRSQGMTIRQWVSSDEYELRKSDLLRVRLYKRPWF